MVRRLTIAALMVGLLALPASVLPPAQAAIRIDNSIGFATAPDQKWRGGCARYAIRWDYRPPNDEWAVKVQIYAPRGFRIHHLLLDAGADPTRGTERVTFCGSTVKPGRFKMISTMIYDVGREVHYVRSDPTYFKLYKPRKKRR
ncbi:hypothetical protein ABFT23_08120 [Nocardioides sp. C4-1]|uniref:hypothetical protein n=1 Tax=Nocardioides sp. C4-1 TaxID=3151851 RepID=UPI003263E338